MVTTDLKDTLYVPRQTSDTIVVEGLRPFQAYVYRTYAVANSDTIFAEYKQLSSIKWEKGGGTPDDPFLIETEEDLYSLSQNTGLFSDFKDCYFRLENDLYIRDGFRHIGQFLAKNQESGYYFNGVFDGNGKSLTINFDMRSFSDYQTCAGVFGAVGPYGVVKDLNVVYTSLLERDPNGHVGIIAGLNAGAIINCHVSGSDLYDNHLRRAGGIVANNYGMIASCTNHVNITGKDLEAGGIAAYNYGSIINCVNYGDITCQTNGILGGIVAYSQGGHLMPDYYDRTYQPLVYKCENHGKISSKQATTHISAGGIAGAATCEISECANYGDMSIYCSEALDILCVGGIAGDMDGKDVKSNISKCLNQAQVKVAACAKAGGKAAVGGICGASHKLVVENCCNDGELFCFTVEDSDPVVPKYNNLMISANNYYCDNVLYETSSEQGICYTANQMGATVNALNANSGKNIWTFSDNGGLTLSILTNKILFVGQPFFPTTSGFHLPLIYESDEDATLEVIEGYSIKDGKAVLNLPLEKGKKFSLLELENLAAGKVYHVRVVTNSQKSDWRKTATLLEGMGLQGDAFEISSIDNLTALSTLVQSGMIGRGWYFKQTTPIDLMCDSLTTWTPIGSDIPLTGDYDGGGYKITNLHVSGLHFYSGLFGEINGSVRNLSLVGHNIVATPNAKYAGGIVGSITGEIDKCLFHGTVSGGDYVGGLCGKTEQGISNCGVVLTLQGKKHAGGITAVCGTAPIKDSYAVVHAKECTPSAIVPQMDATPNIMNVYFQQDDNLDMIYGTPLSSDEMASDVLLSNLASGVWTSDTEPYLNDGYPLLNGATGMQPTVTTATAKVTAKGRVTLLGSCFSGNKKPNKTGFEIKVDRQTSTMSYEEIVNTCSSVIDIIAEFECDTYNGNKYSYRAFADIDGTLFYGEDRIIDRAILGDVNEDEEVNIGDVVTMVNYILQKNPPVFWFEAGDINVDGDITMSDALSVIDIILAKETVPAQMSRSFSLDCIEVSETTKDNGQELLPINLTNSSAYSAFQMDVCLPSGVHLQSVELTSRASKNHIVLWRKLANGKVRIVAYSPVNDVFTGNDGELANIYFLQNGNTKTSPIKIENAVFVTSEGHGQKVDNATSVSEPNDNGQKIYTENGQLIIVSDKETEVQLYNIQGIHVQTLSVKAGQNVYGHLQPGIYVVDKTKVVVE